MFAKFTEEDIKNGAPLDSESRLKCVISKLGDYEGDTVTPYEPKKYCSQSDIPEILAQVSDVKSLETMLKLYFHANIEALQKDKNLDAEWNFLLGELGKHKDVDTGILEKLLALLGRV